MLRTISARLFILSCLLLLSTSNLYAVDQAPVLENQKDKESYSIGYQVGMSIKNDGVEVDFKKLIQGLQEAMEGKKPLVTHKEMKKLIVDLKKRARDHNLKKYQELTVKNAEESEKFLAENGKKEGVKTTDSGLQYKILKEGDGILPKLEDVVSVHYRGTFIDGTEFDSSYLKDAPTTVQTDGVIKGWTEALQMMKAGSKWKLFVPPHLAYGRGGSDKVPSNKVLVFEMELLSIVKEEDSTK